jgi:hypothetical protein
MVENSVLVHRPVLYEYKTAFVLDRAPPNRLYFDVELIFKFVGRPQFYAGNIISRRGGHL